MSNRNVIVIGGGAAGMMAALFAARGGAHVVLLERNEKLGKKVHYFESFDEIENFLLENCVPNELLITMGAGDVVKIGESLLGL